MMVLSMVCIVPRGHECECADDKIGFATRENPEVASENQHSQEAEAQAIAWFTRYLVKS